MNTLPFDYSRCNPELPNEYCKNCRRWFKHPEQVNNPYGQFIVSLESSSSEACVYTPISLQGQSGSASPGLQGRLSRH
jgi:hypothetical protein